VTQPRKFWGLYSYPCRGPCIQPTVVCPCSLCLSRANDRIPVWFL